MKKKVYRNLDRFSGQRINISKNSWNRPNAWMILFKANGFLLIKKKLLDARLILVHIHLLRFVRFLELTLAASYCQHRSIATIAVMLSPVMVMLSPVMFWANAVVTVTRPTTAAYANATSNCNSSKQDFCLQLKMKLSNTVYKNLQ